METAEGMTRQLTQQMKSLSQAFGSLFLPILVKILPYIQAFVELLTEGVRWLASLFGIEIQDIGDTWHDYSTGVGDAIENTDGVTDSIKDATEAAKALKNASIGIDELNVISPSTASGGAGGAGGSGAGGAGGGYDGLDIKSLWDDSIFDGIQQDIDRIKEKMKEWLPTLQVIAGALAGWTIASLLGQLGDALKLGDDFAGKVTTIKKLAASAIIIAIQFKLMGDAFEDFMGEDGTIYDYIEAALIGAGSTYLLYKQWGKGGLAIGLGVTAAVSLKSVIDAGGVTDMESAIVTITGLATAVGALATGYSALSGAVDKLKTSKMVEFFTAAKQMAPEVGWLAALFPKLSTAITGAMGSITSGISGLGGLFSAIGTAIMAHPWVAVAVAVIAALVGAIVLAVVDYDFTEIGRKFGEMLGNAVKTFLNFVKWIGDAWADVLDWFDGLTWDNIDAKFREIGWDIVLGLMNGITSGWKNLVSNIKEFVNGFVQGFKEALGIHSPSKVFADIGKYCLEGLINAFSINAIKDRLVSMWTAAKSWWQSKRGTLAAYTPSIGNISAKLSSAWTTAKNWWNQKRSSLSYTPSIGSIYEKLYDRWKNARDWWNKKKGSMSYTPSIGSIVDKVKSAWNTAKNWWNKNVKLSTKLDIKVPKISVKWSEATAFGKSFKYPSGFDLKFAANGGIFDQGSLIWAGERGPEVMATAAGGKTGVMNVQQMQDAVYEGVYAAVSAAMRGHTEGGNQSVNVYLDGRQITASVEKRQRERGASIMGNEVYSY